ncbi:MAG: hypothetical protein BJ554DRAFT_8052 [Olpidium bornovanus]|uniref:Uncharacterized protein n=1 Tax=Olpidium bornovanus TaxID=278681 RepID=A0A8H7ZVK8_9FUNG|nr:MAG: hypothetical protein BJ554DRAFT_8052 [Olpidium bornovanus]
MPVQILSPPSEPERVVLTHAPSGDTCEVYLHGATLTSWLDGSKGIRGGIPLVFPQFAAPEQTADDDSEVAGRFSLDETHISEQARQLWPFKFQLIYTVTLKASSLSTYITDVSKLSIHGLKGCKYTDKTDGMKQKRRTEEVIKISGALDAVHDNVVTNDFVLDVGHGPDFGGVLVHKDGFQDVGKSSARNFCRCFPNSQPISVGC